MCRSIVVLRGQAVGPEEIAAAARQYVRKVSGSREPSRANAEAFSRAVEQVARATEELLAAWQSPPRPTPAQP